jgi:AI-2 transport system substrate-binding protein
MRKKILSVLLVGAMVSSLLAGCGGGTSTGDESNASDASSTDSAATSESSSDTAADTADTSSDVISVEGMTVAFIPKLTGNAFFEVANDGAQAYAADWGMTVDYMGNSTAGVSEQVAVINQAISAGVDAICISTVDAAGVADALQEAKDAGIVVTTWDSDAHSEDRALMVSQGTPEVLGQMLVDMAVAGLEARGIDPANDEVKYCWHYSQATVTDQNSWQVEGEKIIAQNYPNWVNVYPDNYYSEQDAEKSITVGEGILDAYPDIDLIICNDSTALPGQLQAAENKGYNKDNITITGFATPNAVKQYCNNGTLYNWGLWDCGLQGAMGCYVAAYLAAGNNVKVGDVIDIPEIGSCEVLSNDSISAGDTTADENNGVVLLPERLIFTEENMNDYDF